MHGWLVIILLVSHPFESMTFDLYSINLQIKAKNDHSFSLVNGKAAEYGILKEGYMFESSTGLSRM